MKYYISRAGQQYGPYSTEDLQRMKAQGQIDPNDLVWGEGMPSWVPIAQVMDAAPAATPVAPAEAPVSQPYTAPPQQPYTPTQTPAYYAPPALVSERGIRLVAYLIDLLLAIILGIAFRFIPFIGSMLSGLVLGCYWLLRDMNGASLGKTALGLRVVTKDGRESTTNQRITRNFPLAIGPLLMLIPFAGLFIGPAVSLLVIIIELILVLTQGERIGDKIAGTIVVKKAALPAPPSNASYTSAGQ